MKSVLALTALALASASTLVLAEPGPFAGPGAGNLGAMMMDRMKAADTNGDAMISKAEAAAMPRLAANFDAIDANKDGQLTVDELRAFHQAHRGQGGAKAGLVGPDGKLTKEQFLARAAERFDRLDANKDGVVTADEMRAAHGKRGGL